MADRFVDHDLLKEAKAEREPMSDNYVGYGHPPIATRFKKGERSRNPRGRPRKDKHVVTIDTLAILLKPVKIKVKGKVKIAPAVEANLRLIIANAINGDMSAIRAAIDLMMIYGILKRKSFKPFIDHERSSRELEAAYAAADAAMAAWEQEAGHEED